jgi:hypothetical protein
METANNIAPTNIGLAESHPTTLPLAIFFDKIWTFTKLSVKDQNKFPPSQPPKKEE